MLLENVHLWGFCTLLVNIFSEITMLFLGKFQNTGLLTGGHTSEISSGARPIDTTGSQTPDESPPKVHTAHS